MAKLKYSLVIPVYLNETCLPDLLEACTVLNEQLNNELEIIFVVDGSPDRCFEILEQRLPDADFASKLLLHSRNFGSFAGIRCGLSAAEGEYFAVMAADLQEPPELVLEFFSNLEKGDVDVVVGTRSSRSDPLLSRLSSEIFWRLYKKFVIPEMPHGGVDMFGCNGQFLEQLLKLEESHGSLVGLIFWLGFRRKEVPYQRVQRKHGKSAWTLRKKINYLMDSIFAFSDLPIKLLISIGVIGMTASIVISAVIISLKIFGVMEVPGYAATMTAILFFGAMNALSIGIVGSYVWRSYGNTQNRPLAITMRSLHFPGRQNGQTLKRMKHKERSG